MCALFLGGVIKISALDVRAWRWRAGIYCVLNVKWEPSTTRLVFILAFAGTHLTTHSHWRQRGCESNQFTDCGHWVCVCVCVSVWWNYTRRNNTSLGLITGLFGGEIASLLLDKGIICSAMFRWVLFPEALTHCLFPLHPFKYRLGVSVSNVPICVLPSPQMCVLYLPVLQQ